jgi:hypothetical protein
MQSEHIKAALAAAYLAVILGLGIAIGVSSVSGWIVLTVVGLAPAAVLARLWSAPSQTMSESIRQALR